MEEKDNLEAYRELLNSVIESHWRLNKNRVSDQYHKYQANELVDDLLTVCRRFAGEVVNDIYHGLPEAELTHNVNNRHQIQQVAIKRKYRYDVKYVIETIKAKWKL